MSPAEQNGWMMRADEPDVVLGIDVHIAKMEALLAALEEEHRRVTEHITDVRRGLRQLRALEAAMNAARQES